MKITEGKRYVSTGEAAKLLGVTTWTMINWDKSGKLAADIIEIITVFSARL
ncbi:MAG: hypothetical protein LBS84_11895 [Clostridiales bacterium]|jgi:predicted site-specific integrase-resolvase|nr:hypothetical protein [Clostridiales bacterium]